MSRASINKCIKLYIAKWSDKKLKPVKVVITDRVPVPGVPTYLDKGHKDNWNVLVVVIDVNIK